MKKIFALLALFVLCPFYVCAEQGGIDKTHSVLMPRLQNGELPIFAYFRHAIYPENKKRSYSDEWEVYFALWESGYFICQNVNRWEMQTRKMMDFARLYDVFKLSDEQTRLIIDKVSGDSNFKKGISLPQADYPYTTSSRFLSFRDPNTTECMTVVSRFDDKDSSDTIAYFSDWTQEVYRYANELQDSALLKGVCLTFEMSSYPEESPTSDDYIRGIWLPSSEMGGKFPALSSTLQAYQQMGLNTVYVDMWSRGAVPYLSKFAMLSSEARNSIDLVRMLVISGKISGLRMEAWCEYGFYAGVSDTRPNDRFTSFGLKQVSPLSVLSRDCHGGYTIDNGSLKYSVLCPANPETHKRMIDLFMEMMEGDLWDGLHLDRIRFAGSEFCHCDYCKALFKKETGIDLTDDLVPGHAHWNDFAQWRRKQVNQFMSSLSEVFRKTYPNRVISASVVMPEKMEEHGQYWTDWLDNGWVDYVVPLSYSDEQLVSLRHWIQSNGKYQGKIVYGLDGNYSPNYDSMTLLKSFLPGRGLSYWHWGIMKDYAIQKLLQAQNDKEGGSIQNILNQLSKYKFPDMLHDTRHSMKYVDEHNIPIDAYLDMLRKLGINVGNYYEIEPVIIIPGASKKAEPGPTEFFRAS